MIFNIEMKYIHKVFIYLHPLHGHKLVQRTRLHVGINKESMRPWIQGLNNAAPRVKRQD